MSAIAAKQNSLVNLSQTIEKKRIVKHLESVLGYLEKQSSFPNLSEAQSRKRQETLMNLKEYIQLGEFPINNETMRRRPIFRDELGSYCAMGYLLHKNGRDDVVNEIQANDNYVYVKSITNDEYLDAISDLGLTQEEAARVQPSYGFLEKETNDNTLEMLRILALVVYVLFQLFSLLLIKQINITSTQKTYLYLTMLAGSSLLMLGLWALTIE